MIRSMTGFARRERQGPWGTLSCELRSVNHRYLELSLRLPDDLRCWKATRGSSSVAPCVAARWRRASICAVRVHRRSHSRVQMRRWSASCAGAHPRSQTCSAMRRGPSMCSTCCAGPAWCASPTVTSRRSRPRRIVIAARDAAELNDSRAREGARLRDTLRSALRCAARAGRHGRARLPEVRAPHRGTHAERAAQLGAPWTPSGSSRSSSCSPASSTSRRSSIALRQHVAEIQQRARLEGAVGRRLDFLMQELNREANTLASKSQDVEDDARGGRDVKVLIEQMREQVQNIE